MFCEQCGEKNEEGVQFCTSCGAAINSGATEETAEQPEELATEQTEDISSEEAVLEPVEADSGEKDGFSLLYIIKSVAIIAVLGLLVFGFYNLIGGLFAKSELDYEKHPIVYAKDDEVMLKHAGKKDSYLVADDFENNLDSVQMSDNGNAMFFIYDGKLYYRETTQKEPKGKDVDDIGLKIASDVSEFQINSAGNCVLYLKNDKLYVSDLKNEHSIAKDVSYFEFSENFKKVIYRTSDGDAYCCGLKEKDEPEKIDSKVEYFVSCNDELSKIYYVKEDNLYLKEKGKDEVKIISDVYETEEIEETIFVTTVEEKEKKFADLFDDDCKEEDSLISYPYYSDFRTVDEDGYSVTDYDAYEEAMEKYNAKSQRDRVREYYNNNPQIEKIYSLYKVDGKKTKELAKNLSEVSFYRQIIVKKSGDADKIKLSSVTTFSEAQEKIDDLQSDSEGKKSLFKSDGTVIELSAFDGVEVEQIEISEDEKYLYCMDNGVLNRYEIKNSGLKSKTKLYDNVSGYSLYKGDFLVVSLDDDTYGVINKGKYTEIGGTDIRASRYKDGVYYYITGYDDGDSGTLMKYENGKVEEIDDDVYTYSLRMRSKNLGYYIKDFDEEDSSGDLYQLKGKKTKLIDTDVSGILY